MRRLTLLVTLAAAACCLLPAGASASTGTKWLCLPGAKKNPCGYGLSTTRISTGGRELGTVKVRPDRQRRVDCFYVYPTVSNQMTPTATRSVGAELRSIAIFQASRYSQVCRVFAPVYRQITIYGLLHPGEVTTAMRERAYDDVRSAWRTYLRRYNHGRGVVLIGHSQGTFVLRRLVKEEIDRKRVVRRRLVSALLLGGNVTVKRGSDRGGDFKHLRACRSRTQLGCVVAFSAFGATPPENALFGRAAAPGQEVLCTNPAALGGGKRPLDTLVPSVPFAPNTLIGAETNQVGFPLPKVRARWIELRGGYRARCSSAGGANVLRVTAAGGAPELNALPDASWGLHLADANLALGDLVRLVRAQGARFAAR